MEKWEKFKHFVELCLSWKKEVISYWATVYYDAFLGYWFFKYLCSQSFKRKTTLGTMAEAASDEEEDEEVLPEDEPQNFSEETIVSPSSLWEVISVPVSRSVMLMPAHKSQENVCRLFTERARDLLCVSCSHIIKIMWIFGTHTYNSVN